MNRVITCPLMTAGEFAQVGHFPVPSLDICWPEVDYGIHAGQGGDGFRGTICRKMKRYPGFVQRRLTMAANRGNSGRADARAL
jgi:hypothetical protein